MKYFYPINNFFLEIVIENIANEIFIKKITFVKHPESNKILFNIKNKSFILFINKIESFFQNYFIDKKWEEPPPFLLSGTDFQKNIWKTLRQIPMGEVITYSELAKKSGYSRNYARAVGNACHQNPIPIIVPCHRVIGKNLTLTGYNGGLEIKKWLLQHEGYQW